MGQAALPEYQVPSRLASGAITHAVNDNRSINSVTLVTLSRLGAFQGSWKIGLSSSLALLFSFGNTSLVTCDVAGRVSCVGYVSSSQNIAGTALATFFVMARTGGINDQWELSIGPGFNGATSGLYFTRSGSGSGISMDTGGNFFASAVNTSVVGQYTPGANGYSRNTYTVGTNSSAIMAASGSGGTASASLTLVHNASGNSTLTFSGPQFVMQGATPIAWSSTEGVVQMSSIVTYATVTSTAQISVNAVWDGASWKYITTAAVANLFVDPGASLGGIFSLRYAASGTAGTAITWKLAVQFLPGTGVQVYDATAANYITYTAVTATTASAGAQTLPANPVGFLFININGTDRKVPYYAN